VAFLRQECYGREMMRYRATLAIIVAASSSAALATTERSAARLHPFESCVTMKALALEPSGAQVSEILAAAEQACRDAKGGLSKTAAGEMASKARLAVMQQRSNALNTRRRG